MKTLHMYGDDTYMGDHTIPSPYKVKGPYVHVGDLVVPIPYKVLGDHKSHIRQEDTLHVGGPYVHVGGPYDSSSI